MRTDHPDPAERELLLAEDLLLAELLTEYRHELAATPAFLARAAELSLTGRRRLRGLIALYEALAANR